jgi:serine/threonine protein kinase
LHALCTLTTALLQVVARQLIEAVAFMHELRLIHTDLKPENILLVNAEYTRLPPVDAAVEEGGDRHAGALGGSLDLALAPALALLDGARGGHLRVWFGAPTRAPLTRSFLGRRRAASPV